MNRIIIEQLTETSVAAHFSGGMRTTLGRTKEVAVGMLVKDLSRRFGIDPEFFSLDEPSQTLGELILASPEAFGVIIEDRTTKTPGERRIS